MIPDEAVEAAARAYRETVEWIDRHSRDDYGREDELGARAALKAAYPIMLSHEREETRLAHVDAVVNAETIGELQSKLDRVRELHTEDMFRDHLSNGFKICGGGVGWPCPTIAALD